MNTPKRKTNAPLRSRMQPITLAKALCQLVFLLLAPGAFSSAFGAVKATAGAIGRGDALALSGNVTLLLVVLGFTLLFGRFFCGNACAFGTLGDVLHACARKVCRLVGAKLPILPRSIQRALTLLKYGVLAALLALCFMGGQSWLHGKSPWDAFAQLLSLAPAWAGYEVGYLTLALLAVGMALVPRFFCRFLCPLGAIFSLLPPALLVRLEKPQGACDGKRPCGSCQLCNRACPAGLSLTRQDSITSGQCFRCHKCVGECYQSKPFLRMGKRRLPTVAAILVEGALLLAVLMALGLTR